MAFGADILFPRSRGSEWTTLLDLHGRSLDEIADSPFDLRRSEFHPAGAQRVSDGQLRGWRSDLNRWAYDHAFPAPLNEKMRSKWDVALGQRLLDDTSELAEGDNPAVWCWLATHLLPHFVLYRWGWPNFVDGQAPRGRAPWARFGPTDKNGLLMARQRVLVYGADLTRRASEQEFQSIQYRPAYGLDRRVARVVLETLVDAVDDPDSNYGRQGSTRSDDADDVCVELRVINSLRPMCFMSDQQIRHLVEATIERLPEIRDPRKEARRNATKYIDGQEVMETGTGGSTSVPF